MIKRTPARVARLVAQWRRAGIKGELREAITFRRGPSGIGVASCRTSRRTGTVTPAGHVRAGAVATETGGPCRDRVPGGERLQVGSDASVDLVRAVVAALRSPW